MVAIHQRGRMRGKPDYFIATKYKRVTGDWLKNLKAADQINGLEPAFYIDLAGGHISP